jgi:type I restriction enzyme S subunit
MTEAIMTKTKATNESEKMTAASWEQSCIGRIVEMQSGFACARKYAVPHGLPHLRPFNIGTDGEVDLGEVINIPKDYLDNITAYALQAGDVLFNNTNSVELVGKTAVIRNPFCCGFSNHLTRLRIRDKEQLDPAWLTLCLRVLWMRGFFAQYCNRWIGQAGFNPTKLATLAIPLPHMDVQRRIVARVEALMAEIKKARTLLEQMRRDADLLMDAALKEFVDHLPPTRKPLIDVIESKPRNGWSPKCDDKPNGIPVLKLGAVLWFRYNPNEVKRTSQPVNRDAHYWLQPGDVLISRSNTPELVGHASIYTGTPFPCIYPDLLMRFRVRESEANSNFLIYWLRTREVREYINRRASGASPTMKKIKQDNVCNLPFPTIDVERQMHWVAHLDSIQSDVDELMRLLEQDAKLLDQLEQSILERAFRGEL